MLDKKKIMRSVFFIIVITLLIGGIPVITNYNTGVIADTSTRKETIDMFKKTAKKPTRQSIKLRI